MWGWQISTIFNLFSYTRHSKLKLQIKRKSVKKSHRGIIWKFLHTWFPKKTVAQCQNTVKMIFTLWSHHFILLSAKLGLWPSFCRKIKPDVLFLIFFFFLFNLSWIKWGRGFVIVTTDHVTAVFFQTGLFVHRWTFRTV